MGEARNIYILGNSQDWNRNCLPRHEGKILSKKTCQDRSIADGPGQCDKLRTHRYGKLEYILAIGHGSKGSVRVGELRGRPHNFAVGLYAGELVTRRDKSSACNQGS